MHVARIIWHTVHKSGFPPYNSLFQTTTGDYASIFVGISHKNKY